VAAEMLSPLHILTFCDIVSLMIKILTYLVAVIVISLSASGVKASALMEDVAYTLLSCMSELKEELVLTDVMTAFQVSASKQRNFDPRLAQQTIRSVRKLIDKSKDDAVYRCNALTKGALEVMQGRTPIISQFAKDGIMFVSKRRDQKQASQLPAPAAQLKTSRDPKRLNQLYEAPLLRKALRNAAMMGRMSACLGNAFPFESFSKIGRLKLQIILIRLGENPNSDNAGSILGMHQPLIDKGRKQIRDKPSLCKNVIRISEMMDFNTINEGVKSHIKTLNSIRRKYGLPEARL
jgi:hypothetical protein